MNGLLHYLFDNLRLRRYHLLRLLLSKPLHKFVILLYQPIDKLVIDVACRRFFICQLLHKREYRRRDEDMKAMLMRMMGGGFDFNNMGQPQGAHAVVAKPNKPVVAAYTALSYFSIFLSAFFLLLS